MTELTIRFVTEADAATLHHFIYELAAYERQPDAVDVTVATLRQQLAQSRPPFECLLAEQDQQALGFALFFPNYSTWQGKPGIYLEDLFVHSEHRRRGVGLALMSELSRLAIERGCARLEWAVLDWNEPSLAFFESLGAQSMDAWRLIRLTAAPLVQLSQRSSER
jgi:GNAT superfamily N-acetyltransferase